MAGQLILRKEAIARAACQVEFAKTHNYPQGWIDDRMAELRHQVKMFKQVADNARHEEKTQFCNGLVVPLKAIDLMEMGY
jgi:hypothetical protein